MLINVPEFLTQATFFASLLDEAFGGPLGESARVPCVGGLLESPTLVVSLACQPKQIAERQ